MADIARIGRHLSRNRRKAVTTRWPALLRVSSGSSTNTGNLLIPISTIIRIFGFLVVSIGCDQEQLKKSMQVLLSPSVSKQLCGQLVPVASATTAAMPPSTAVPTAETAMPSAEVSSSMSTANEDWSASTDPEYRRREKSAVQGIQRRNLLVVRLGSVLRGITLLLLRHLIPVVVALMAFVDA